MITFDLKNLNEYFSEINFYTFQKIRSSCWSKNTYPPRNYGWNAYYSHYTYNFSEFNKKDYYW